MIEPSDELAIRGVARDFVTALEAGNLQEMKRIYSEDAVIWHNSDAIEMTVAEQMVSFGRAFQYLRELRYCDIVLGIFDGGFVQQHRVTATTPDGRKLNLPGCLVCRVREGHIVRLDEYWDSAALDRIGLHPERPKRPGTV